jgi:hypothetical protein
MVTSLAACVSVQEGEGDEVGVGEQTVLVENALTSNALTSSALRDPLARQLLKYVVSCALSSGAHFDVNIDGVVYGFDGELGLHKKWGDTGGSCDNACKTWVSACVLSRINHLGLATPISMRGNKGELSSDSAEQTTYSIREGAYYGNIFANPPIYYACVSPEKTSIERVCGASLDECVLTVVGSCDDACDKPQGDGSYPNCRDRARDSYGKFPSGTNAYSSVTIFLK